MVLFLLPALLTAGGLTYLYHTTPSTVPTDSESQEVSTRLTRDLHQLVKSYYRKYLYPHAPPKISFVIPATSSVTHNNEVVHVMITDRKGRLYPYNTLCQVGAHECAHALCHSTRGGDHGPEFAKVLARLDALALELKLYDPTAPIPQKYLRECHS